MISKRFDAVAFMRKRREEIDQEDAGLSWEERSRKALRIVRKDPLWKQFERRVADLRTLRGLMISDTGGAYGSSKSSKRSTKRFRARLR